MKRLVVTGFFIFIAALVFAQSNGNKYRFWNQQYLSGEVNLRAHYRRQIRTFGSGFEEYIQGFLLSGGIKLKSSSFLVHPNVMGLDVDMELNPEWRSEEYTASPDRSDVNTLTRLHVQTTFFQEKPFTINAFVDMGQNYISRESLTNSRTKRFFWGGGMSYRNKILPVTVNYREGSWVQNDIGTDRTYSYWQRTINGEMTKSFFKYDKNRLTYSYNDYINKEFYTDERHNTVQYVELVNDIPFDAKRNYNLYTLFSNYYQVGTDNLNRFQAMVNYDMNLPANFKVNAGYTYFDQQYPSYSLDQHSAKLNFGHFLFRSLRTNIYGEYTYNKHSVYTENDSRVGFNINYTKSIPTGTLSISYGYFKRFFDRESELGTIDITAEEHVLSDDQITLLDEPFVQLESVVVKDITGTIIFELDVDYILIEHDSFLEIKRLPGGFIPNNSSVYIDYTSLLPGSYKFTLNNQLFNINLMLFSNLLELYYQYGKQNYTSLENTEYIPLNYFTQNLVGIRFTISFVKIGVEYDRYKSSITPYELIRYYTNLHWQFKDKLLVALTGNVRHYLVISDRTNEWHADITAKLAYSFTRKSKLNFELGYRNDKGYEIDLNLLTARAEYMIIIRKLDITAGLELYRRDYLDRETINFNGAYVRISRKF